ncbi:MAG: hypothetical protein FWE68_05815, partial [Defluviitaleaceae bacterium]|nr:hypothetical protein [Defluviitaleaceae bacterium]
KADVSSLKQGQTRLELIIENEIIPDIRLLTEGHGNIVRRLDHIQPVVDNLQEDVAVIRAVVSGNSRDIKNLKAAI